MKAVFIFVLFIAMLLSAVYLYLKNGMGVPEQKIASNNPVTAQNQENEQQNAPGAPETLIDKVKRHLVVSETDIPYIATITNIDLVKEKNPDFYADATDGDKVIVWKDRAVIYSESKDRVVAVATAKPLLAASSDASALVASASSSASNVDRQVASTTIEIRNGSHKNGAAKSLKQQLETLGLNIAKVGDTATLYEGTKIVDLSGGSASAVIDMISKSTSGTVLTAVPAGEKTSTAQVLILIGR